MLTDQTKLETAVWLLGVKVGQNVKQWPETVDVMRTAKTSIELSGEKLAPKKASSEAA